MTSLDAYLRDEYQLDKQQLWRTQEIVRSVVPLFVKYQQQYRLHMKPWTRRVIKIKTWPYSVKNGIAANSKYFSDSTHCMIAFALDAILQGNRPATPSSEVGRVLYPVSVRLPKIEIGGLHEVVLNAKQDFIRELTRRGEPLTTSWTFGDDDPFTLTWLAELLDHYELVDGDDITPEMLRACKAKAFEAARTVWQRGQFVLMLETKGSKRRHYEIPHCFPMLRCVHLAKVAAQIRQPGAKKLEFENITPQMFQDHVYRQLGFFSIPDSRFDPAVLVFAMEGVLQFDARSLSDSTIELVIQTLESSQKRNPYWRPVTPFLSDSQGIA